MPAAVLMNMTYCHVDVALYYLRAKDMKEKQVEDPFCCWLCHPITKAERQWTVYCLLQWEEKQHFHIGCAPEYLMWCNNNHNNYKNNSPTLGMTVFITFWIIHWKSSSTMQNKHQEKNNKPSLKLAMKMKTTEPEEYGVTAAWCER